MMTLKRMFWWMFHQKQKKIKVKVGKTRPDCRYRKKRAPPDKPPRWAECAMLDELFNSLNIKPYDSIKRIPNNNHFGLIRQGRMKKRSKVIEVEGFLRQ